MKDQLLVPCLEGCGNMVNAADRDNIWIEHIGVAKKRAQGGMNDLKIKKPTGRFMCETCYANQLAGVAPGQVALVG